MSRVLSSKLGACLVLGGLLLPQGAAAQGAAPDGDGDGVPDASDACPQEPGVKSSDAKTSGCAAKVDSSKVKSKAEVTFTGYQSLPGGRGKIFVDLTDAVAVEVSRVGPVIEYKLVGARVPLRNNKNPLLLQDFGASALSAVLITDKPAKAGGHVASKGKAKPKRQAKAPAKEQGVRLVITLRGQTSPTFRMVARTKGATLEIDLPPLAQ